MTRNRVFALTAALVILADQATKHLVAARMQLGESLAIIDGFISLTYIRNTGIAFGLFNDGHWWGKTALLSLATLAALVFLFWFLREFAPGDLTGGAAVGLVAGGAVGNLADRLRMGEVVDFIDVFWRSYHWPSFNLADSSITVGVVLLIAHQFLHGKKGREASCCRLSSR